MFESAVSIANGFTFPYVGMRRRANGEVFSTVAAFVVLNEGGWILTSGHIIDEIVACDRHKERLAADGDEEDRESLVRDHSEIWALPGFEHSRPRLTYAKVNRAADIAVGRLEPFDPTVLGAQPVLRNASKNPLAQGASVCLVGFPFHKVAGVFSEADGRFDVASSAFPVPRFAIDGIVSRFRRRALQNGASGLFIETSSPGLRGQSGGPLLDVDGRIIGIQSHTEHLDLGFDASYSTAGGETIVERQFLNVGAATHVDEARSLLDAEKVEYRTV